MQNPEYELPGFINALLQSPADKQRELIEQYYTSGCRLTHALVVAENREEVLRVFQHWRFMNAALSATVQELVVDASRSKVWVQFVQHIECFLHTPVSFHLPMSSLLYLCDSPLPGGGKLICKQVDYHSFEGILFTWPLMGPVMERVVRRLLTWSILVPAQLAAALWPPLDDTMAGMLGSHSWAACKQVAAWAWWRRLPRPAGGRDVAPYTPTK